MCFHLLNLETAAFDKTERLCRCKQNVKDESKINTKMIEDGWKFYASAFGIKLRRRKY